MTRDTRSVGMWVRAKGKEGSLWRCETETVVFREGWSGSKERQGWGTLFRKWCAEDMKTRENNAKMQGCLFTVRRDWQSVCHG